MKKSSEVPLGLVATIATFVMTGCGPRVTQTRHCIDPQTGQVLPDQDCEQRRPIRHGGMFFYPRYVYGGTGGGAPGTFVRGYSETPARGARIVSPSGHVISRGGFGGIGRGLHIGG